MVDLVGLRERHLPHDLVVRSVTEYPRSGLAQRTSRKPSVAWKRCCSRVASDRQARLGAPTALRAAARCERQAHRLGMVDRSRATRVPAVLRVRCTARLRTAPRH
jgi:hypothetical protein